MTEALKARLRDIQRLADNMQIQFCVCKDGTAYSGRLMGDNVVAVIIPTEPVKPANPYEVGGLSK